MDPFLIFSFLILLSLSAFFSGTEIALMSLAPHKIDSLLKSKAFGSKALKEIKKNNDKLLVTILIGNNLVNTLTASIATTTAMGIATNYGLGVHEATVVGLSTGIVTICLLLFGEIIPKSFASKNATKIALLVAPFYRFLMFILYPVVIFFEAITKFFSKDKPQEAITGEEIDSFIDMGKKSGGIDEDEHEKIKSILEFDDITVEEVMTPRVKIDAISIDCTIEKATIFYLSHTHTRLPIYNGTIDKIDYFITGRDLLKEYRLGNLDMKISDMKLKKVLKVPLTQSISTLLETLQNAHKTMSIIVDEYGGVAGLVTIEDIIEEVFGDIKDETDQEIEEFIKVGENGALVESDLLIEDILCELDLELDDLKLKGSDFDFDEFDGETLSYVIVHILGRFPHDGEVINIDIEGENKSGILSLKVLEIRNAKIGKVDLKIVSSDFAAS